MLILAGLLTGCHDDDDLAKIKEQRDQIIQCNDKLFNLSKKIIQYNTNNARAAIANQDQAIIEACGDSFLNKITPNCGAESVAKAKKDAKADLSSDDAKSALSYTYWEIIGFKWLIIISTLTIAGITIWLAFIGNQQESDKNIKRPIIEPAELESLKNELLQKTEENNSLKDRLENLRNMLSQTQQNEEDDTPDERDERIAELETEVEKLKKQVNIANAALEMKKLF